jgi:hypothetical protein
MAENIEDGSSVPMDALREGDLPADEVVAWCSAMLVNVRMGFIARKPLEALRDHVQATRTR